MKPELLRNQRTNSLAKSIPVLLILFLFFNNNSHANWNVAQKANMPWAISNNAVTSAEVNGNWYVYSFSGIDTSRVWSGISNRSMRYDVLNNTWDTLPPLPASNTWIAAGASTVKGKIYIIGGYHVFQNGNEVSNSEVYIFNPQTNSYEANGAQIPVAIDDHVQAVWRDSLIYVVTGWSNTTNVPNVQIYNPSDNSWIGGTSVPNNIDYKVFGGSGTIIGDTLYYIGGARTGTNFPLTSIFRMGVIQPYQPDSITWYSKSDPLALGYRMAAFSHDGKPYWLGGSKVSYNYNGVAYNGSGGVPAENRLIYYDPVLDTLVEDTGVVIPIMDLRGIGQVAHNQWILCGGMLPGQVVTNQAYHVFYGQLTNSKELEKPMDFELIQFEDRVELKSEDFESVILMDLKGRKLASTELTNGTAKISVQNLTPGIYLVSLQVEQQIRTKKIFVR